MKFKSLKNSSIDLYGIFGSFEIINSKYKVKYCSTIANNRDDSEYQELMKELKPMRERVLPGQINDLSSLLQRDLNDHRVASDLIPYLLNQVNNTINDEHIAFFPSILCALIPNGFIQKDSGKVQYPIPIITDTSENTNTKYGKDWETNVYKDEKGEPLILGKMSINRSKTSIIVLDGQHRANAFRYISNGLTFEGRNEIYKSFYNSISIPEKLNADLPVTIIWFEANNSKDSIKPDLISRKLFLDVNQSAKTVNKSRFVLLNDREPSSVFTRFFYSLIAKNSGFSSDTFSLLHSGFDYDENLSSRKPTHDITITVPELMSYVFDWMFFGKRHYSYLNKYKVGQERERRDLSNLDIYLGTGNHTNFIELNEDIEENVSKVVKSNINLKKFEKAFNDKIGIHLYELLNKFPLIEIHIRASAQIEKMKISFDGEFEAPLMQASWDRLFKGGEGLYYVFKRTQIKLRGEQDKGLMNAAQKIESIFKSLRIEEFKRKEVKSINQAYASLKSIAFQVGYFMSFDFFYRESGIEKIEDAVIQFLNRIKKYSQDEWVLILTELKSLLVSSSDIRPQFWPTYQNLIIRLIQEKDEFYETSKHVANSPDVLIVEKQFLSKCKSYCDIELRRKLEDSYIDEIPKKLKTQYIQDSKKVLKDIFKKINLKILDFDYTNVCLESLESKCLTRDEV